MTSPEGDCPSVSPCGDAASAGATLTATHSHLFVGSRLDAAPDVPLSVSTADVHVVFSDGVVVEAVLRLGHGLELDLVVPAYRTATGHEVRASTWTLRQGGTGEGPRDVGAALKVVARRS